MNEIRLYSTTTIPANELKMLLSTNLIMKTLAMLLKYLRAWGAGLRTHPSQILFPPQSRCAKTTPLKKKMFDLECNVHIPIIQHTEILAAPLPWCSSGAAYGTANRELLTTEWAWVSKLWMHYGILLPLSKGRMVGRKRGRKRGQYCPQSSWNPIWLLPLQAITSMHRRTHSLSFLGYRYCAFTTAPARGTGVYIGRMDAREEC